MSGHRAGVILNLERNEAKALLDELHSSIVDLTTLENSRRGVGPTDQAAIYAKRANHLRNVSYKLSKAMNPRVDC